jgi:serine/threonine protein kinase
MAKAPRPAAATVALSAARRLEQARQRLTASWRAGPPLRIEDLLAEATDAERPALFAELLHLERDLRGPTCSPEQYHARFPEFAAQIDAAFTTTAAARPKRPRRRPRAAADDGPEPPSVPNYDVLGRIDAGGMGVVYEAVHRGLGVKVALKVVRGAPWEAGPALERFRVEARAVAALNHPNVVRIYDYGEWQPAGGGPPLPYYTMEHVTGGSLAAKLGGRPLPPPEAAALAQTLARAVQCVHDRHIVHRDLKPANILLADDGTPKIADFGLAKRLDADPGLTESQAVLGTASYMAPEQAAGLAKQAGPAADLYALGVILYECLTGRPPFREETYALTVHKVLTEEPAPPRRLEPAVPPDLEAVCLKCLEKEPGRRYASAGELADDLGRVLAGEPPQAAAVDVAERHGRLVRKAGYEVVKWRGYGRTDNLHVYEARDAALGRRVILKVDGSAPDSPARARFRREAEITAGLYHPNVAQLYRFGEEGGLAYAVLEYVDGGSLTQRFSGQALPARQAAQLVEALAQAVNYLHQQGVVHGGLVPGNVLMTATDVPKLGGFGMAWRLDEPPEARPREEFVGGDLAYLAPEVVGGLWEQVGPAADLYGLGGVLYRLLTSHRPYGGRTVAEKRENVLSGALRLPRAVKRDVPEALEALCLKCLDRDPSRRHASAAAVASDLRAFLKGRPARARRS